MTEPPKFSIDCKSCGHATLFDRYDLPELDEFIENEVRDEREDAHREAEREYEDHIDPAHLFADTRPFWELAAAIRRGDTFEAEVHLDRIASNLGTVVEEQVQQGRYSLRARAA